MSGVKSSASIWGGRSRNDSSVRRTKKARQLLIRFSLDHLARFSQFRNPWKHHCKYDISDSEQADCIVGRQTVKITMLPSVGTPDPKAVLKCLQLAEGNHDKRCDLLAFVEGSTRRKHRKPAKGVEKAGAIQRDDHRP